MGPIPVTCCNFYFSFSSFNPQYPNSLNLVKEEEEEKKPRNLNLVKKRKERKNWAKTKNIMWWQTKKRRKEEWTNKSETEEKKEKKKEQLKNSGEERKEKGQKLQLTLPSGFFYVCLITKMSLKIELWKLKTPKMCFQFP